MAKSSRRIIINGTYPARRAPHSGFFGTKIKEDAFYIDFNEREMQVLDGARTEGAFTVPLHAISDAPYTVKRFVETVKLHGTATNLLMQYAQLPLFDPWPLRGLSAEMVARAEEARQTLIESGDPQALLERCLLALLDEPIVQATVSDDGQTVRLKARIPPPPNAAHIADAPRKANIGLFREYVDLICSKAVLYAGQAFEEMPRVSHIELEMIELSPADQVARVAEGIGLGEFASPHARFGFRYKNELAVITEKPPQKKRSLFPLASMMLDQRAERKRAKAGLPALTTIRPEDRQPHDELFDGRLPVETSLLAVTVERGQLREMVRSKHNIAARAALAAFDLRFRPDDSALVLRPIAAVAQTV